MKANLTHLTEREAEAIGDLLVEHQAELGISFERIGQILEHRLAPAFGRFADAPLYERLCDANRANTPDEVDARPGDRELGEYIYLVQLRPPNGAWYYQVDAKDPRFKVKHFKKKPGAYARARDYQQHILSAMANGAAKTTTDYPETGPTTRKTYPSCPKYPLTENRPLT